jgi:hypothetical protein
MGSRIRQLSSPLAVVANKPVPWILLIYSPRSPRTEIAVCSLISAHNVYPTQQMQAVSVPYRRDPQGCYAGMNSRKAKQHPLSPREFYLSLSQTLLTLP